MKRLFVLFLLLIGGCTRYVPPAETPALNELQRDYMLCVLLDTSGSYDDLLFGNDGRGYRFFLKSCEKYFERMEDNDRVLISALSDNQSGLLFEGSPTEMRKKFRSADGLKRTVDQKRSATGSPIYVSLADTLNYLSGLPGVKAGTTRLCILVLSDMEDTSSTPDVDRAKAVAALRNLSHAKGSIGFYWVSQSRIGDTRQMLSDAGMPVIAEPDFVENPPLPIFVQ